MANKVLTEEQKQLIIATYKKEKNIQRTAKLMPFVVGQEFTSKILKEAGIDPYACKREWKQDFFAVPNEINSYWAGFMLADGCLKQVKKNGTHALVIAISIKDVEHLWKFCMDIGLGSGPNIQRNQNQCQVSLTSSRIAEDLLQYGVHVRKSYEFIPPTISDDLLPHFFRGLIDGDGSITISTYKGTFTALFSLVGNRELMTWVGKKMKEIGYTGNVPVYTDKRVNPDFSYGEIKISGQNRLIEIGQLLKYKNYPRMDRKWSKVNKVKEHIAAKPLPQFDRKAYNKIYGAKRYAENKEEILAKQKESYERRKVEISAKSREKYASKKLKESTLNGE